jgi:hypothetical protein
MCDLAVTHKLHYIVDGNGNYYRVNDKDQLVMAKDWRDAGVFSFADANQRIGGGKKSHFYSAIPIEPDTVSSVSDNDSKDIIRVLPEISVQEAGDSECEVPMQVESLKETEDVELSLPYDLKRMDWEEYMLHFAYISSNVQNYKEELIEKQSELDLQISDILHYIELYDVTEAESARMVQLLKECREERRDVKDEWCRVDHFQRAIGNSSNVAKVKEAMKQLAKLEKRSYKPRKLKKMFKNCPEYTKRENKLMRVFSSGNCMQYVDETKTNEKLMDEPVGILHMNIVKENREGSGDMEFMKQWTVFDGKTNDWIGFAKQQREFYENVEQYMINLQLEVAELGARIESLLCDIEDANYNVAQGYKVFKALKDLRNERKDKQEELLQLQILTGCVDCQRMTEVLQASLQEMEMVRGEARVCEKMESVMKVG